jgi:DNA-binding response OmpR family regulator
MEAARVLVVDDERSILQLLNEALTHWGYRVTTCATGYRLLLVMT